MKTKQTNQIITKDIDVEIGNWTKLTETKSFWLIIEREKLKQIDSQNL